MDRIHRGISVPCPRMRSTETTNDLKRSSPQKKFHHYRAITTSAEIPETLLCVHKLMKKQQKNYKNKNKNSPQRAKNGRPSFSQNLAPNVSVREHRPTEKSKLLENSIQHSRLATSPNSFLSLQNSEMRLQNNQLPPATKRNQPVASRNLTSKKPHAQ